MQVHIIDALVGKTDKDMPTVVKSDKVKPLSVSVAKIFTIADDLIADGKLVKDEAGKYQKLT